LAKRIRLPDDTNKYKTHEEFSDGEAQSPRSTILNHLVYDVYLMLSHGPKSWLRMEDGATAFLPGHTFRHALRLRLQKVAERALSISTDHTSGFNHYRSEYRIILNGFNASAKECQSIQSLSNESHYVK